MREALPAEPLQLTPVYRVGMKAIKFDVDGLASSVSRYLDHVLDDFYVNTPAPDRRIRVHKDKTEVVIEVDVPGVPPGDVSVSVDSGVLRVAWKREDHSGLHEREHLFSISRNADVAGITAKVLHGLLTVRVPMSGRDSSSRKVDVTSG